MIEILFSHNSFYHAHNFPHLACLHDLLEMPTIFSLSTILSCPHPSLSSSLLVYCHVTISLSSLHQHLCLAQIIFKWPHNGSFDSLDVPCLSCFLVNVIMHVLSHLCPSCLVPITPCHVIMLRHLFESLFVIYCFNEIMN